MRTLLLSLGSLALLVGTSGCGDDSGGGVGGGGSGGTTAHPDPDPLPPLSSDIELTTAATIVPTHDIVQAALNPSIVEDLEKLLADGFGDYAAGPGWDAAVRTIDGSAPPAPGANPRGLVRFVHLADT